MGKSKRDFSLRHAVLSDVGRVRSENQDSYGFTLGRDVSLFLVADGMGGARGGATASSLAVNVIANESVDSNGWITESSLHDAIQTANAIIYKASITDENLSGMGTTLVALVLAGNEAFVAHVGDSRIYRLRGGEISRLTRDHTLVQELVDSGSITSEEAANHPIGHMLTRSLGPQEGVSVEINKMVDLPKIGDKFLLCCDGLYNHVQDEEIKNALLNENADNAVEKLVNLAKERGGSDNITVEVIEIHERGNGGLAEKAIKEGEVEVVVSTKLNYDYLRELVNGGLKQDESVEADKDAEEKESLEQGDTDQLETTTGEVDDAGAEAISPEQEALLKKLTWALVGAVTLVVLVVGYMSLAPKQKTKMVSETGSGNQVAVRNESLNDSDDLANELLRQAAEDAMFALDKPESSEQDIPSVKEELGSDRIEKLIQTVSDISVPPISPIMVTGADALPTESISFTTVDAGDNSTSVKGSESNLPNNALISASDADVREMLGEKRDIREAISDIDTRLLATFKFEDEQRIQELADLEARNKEITEALSIVKSDKAKIKSRSEALSNLEPRLRDQNVDILSLANEVSEHSVDVLSAKRELEEASSRYSGALESWNANSGDTELFAEMAEAGREMKTKKAALEEAIRNAVFRGKENAETDIARLQVVEENLENRNSRINRHKGIIEASRPPVSEEDGEQLKQTLLSERQQLIARLGEIRQILPDEEEKTIRERLLPQPK